MAPSDNRHRQHCPTTQRPASDRAENAFEGDALLLESEREAELPYYVEVAGDYSIPHATADHWGSDEALDVEPAPRRNPARPLFRLKGF